MLTYSKLLNKYYNAENGSVVYVSNMLQAQKYLKHGATDEFVDILFTNTKREDSLVFVFLKTPRVQELYQKWQAHELD